MKPLAAAALAILALPCLGQNPKPPMGDDILALMRPLSRQQLILCLKEKPLGCPLDDQHRDPIWIASELGRRKHPELLVAFYRRADKLQRQYIAEALWHINDPKVTEFMRSIAFENLANGPDSDDVFFPLDYLAQRCDERALARLNRRVNFAGGYPVGCMYWAPTLAAFGRCNYRQAASNLVLALNSACVNIIDAAEKGLHRFYPQACQHPKSLDDEAHCYNQAIRKDPTQISHQP